MSYDKYAEIKDWARKASRDHSLVKAEKKMAEEIPDPGGLLGSLANMGRSSMLNAVSPSNSKLNEAMGSAYGKSIGVMAGQPLEAAGQLLTSPLAGMTKGITGGIANTLEAPGMTYGYRLDRLLNSGFGGLMDRIKAPDVAAKKFIESMSGNVADKATDLLADMASKSYSMLTDTFINQPARKAILETLRTEDPIIGAMSEQNLMDAYHSIVKFAPTLASDKNAVRSALRMASESEGGLSYHTIKSLAEAENVVTKNSQGGR